MPHLILKAAAFAADKHRFQQRKDVEQSPYINHPIAVARILSEVGGVSDEDVLAAALLHDTVEDTDTTEAELTEVFGERISTIVMEVTDDKSLPKLERKQAQVDHAPHLSSAATLVKLADKIANVADIGDKPPQGWDETRRREYLDWAETVVENCTEVNADLIRRFREEIAKGRKLLS